jgi:hypothetical protein
VSVLALSEGVGVVSEAESLLGHVFKTDRIPGTIQFDEVQVS